MSTWTWLRQKFAIFFVIGLALSVASFVEGLHMGRDAIDFVVLRLSELTNWPDFFRFLADGLHEVLEWWRGVVRDLFSVLGISVPEWMHDPLSVVFFSLSRALSIGFSKNALRNHIENRARRYTAGLIVSISVAAMLVTIMATLLFGDGVYSGQEFSANMTSIYVGIVLSLSVIFYLFLRLTAPLFSSDPTSVREQ